MIGYTCKYTPVELLEALGGYPVMLDREVGDFQQAERLTHANLCCHAKAALEQGGAMEELIFTDCCDSTRRVYDVLRQRGGHGFLALLDLPHQDGPCARARLRDALIRLAEEYSAHTGVEFRRTVFLAQCRRALAHPLPPGPFLAVLGARMSRPLLELVRAKLPLPVADLTCSGNRALPPLPPGADTLPFEDLMDWYAGALLSMPPCMRMADLTGRRALTEHPGLKGIVYHTVKFCDYYGFEYAQLQKSLSLPMIKLESDFTPQPAGQLATRLEAFAESLGLEFSRPAAPGLSGAGRALFAGIDSGSTSTNMVVLDRERNILASAVVRTGAKAQNGARAALDEVCRQLGCGPEVFSAVLATGYGRGTIPFATDARTEITCHAKGAHFLRPQARTIIDIGGQDSKVICLDETGAVTGFLMNDKCAAGTGRFLEMMARTLELDLPEMSRRGLEWKHELTISSMCTVFAESEVISLIADNHADSDIIHGLCKSIAARTAAMVSRAGGVPPYIMTGGVARNLGVVRALEEQLGAPIFLPEEPDLCGALGAALLALEEQG